MRWARILPESREGLREEESAPVMTVRVADGGCKSAVVWEIDGIQENASVVRLDGGLDGGLGDGLGGGLGTVPGRAEEIFRVFFSASSGASRIRRGRV
jgi:hypothetical protein